MNKIELTEEERRPLLDICDKGLDYEIEDHINKLLKDRIQKERDRIYELIKQESFYFKNDDSGLEDRIVYFSDIDLIFNK